MRRKADQQGQHWDGVVVVAAELLVEPVTYEEAGVVDVVDVGEVLEGVVTGCLELAACPVVALALVIAPDVSDHCVPL